MIVWSQGTPVPSSMGSFPVAMPRVAGLLPRLASSILFSLLFESSSLLPCRAASPPRSPESPSSRRLTPPFPLTSLGKSIRRVVVPTMLPSVCRSSDWRGELPRWFARFLPEAPVVVWDARRWHKVGGDPRVRPINCMVCQDPGRYYFARYGAQSATNRTQSHSHELYYACCRFMMSQLPALQDAGSGNAER